jgi:hypothetical protein
MAIFEFTIAVHLWVEVFYYYVVGYTIFRRFEGSKYSHLQGKVAQSWENAIRSLETLGTNQKHNLTSQTT